LIVAALIVALLIVIVLIVRTLIVGSSIVAIVTVTKVSKIAAAKIVAHGILERWLLWSCPLVNRLERNSMLSVEEHAQNEVRREAVFDTSGCAPHPLRL
jgi:flagellar motor component MotA